MKAKEKHKNKIACCGTIRWGLHRTDLKVRKMSFDERQLPPPVLKGEGGWELQHRIEP